MVIDYLLEYNRYCNIVGIGVIFGIAYFFSFHKSRINYRLVINGLLLQFFMGFIVLKTNWGQTILNGIAEGVTSLYRFADVGTRFIFGNLADAQGPWGVVFALQILPIIIFFGAFMALLFHIGVVQKAVKTEEYHRAWGRKEQEKEILPEAGSDPESDWTVQVGLPLKLI